MLFYTLGTLDLWQKSDHPSNICLDVLHSDQGLNCQSFQKTVHDYFLKGLEVPFLSPLKCRPHAEPMSRAPRTLAPVESFIFFPCFCFFSPPPFFFPCWVSLGFGACMWYFVSQKLLQDLIIRSKQEEPLFPFKTVLQQVRIWSEGLRYLSCQLVACVSKFVLKQEVVYLGEACLLNHR